MAILKKSKKALKNYVGSVSGDLNSIGDKFKSKFGSLGNFSNTFDQRIADGLSDLLTGATGIRTSNIPEISKEVLSTKMKNRESRASVLNDATGGRADDSPGEKRKLTFPEKFDQEDGNGALGLSNYIHFRSLPLRNGSNATATEDGGTLYDIFLYVPDDGLADGTAIEYKAAEKGMLESIMAKLFTLGEGTDQGIGDQMMQGVKEVFTGDIGKAAAGKVTNPMKFNMFEGVEFREFSYTFLLYPKSEPDSKMIREIVYAFKKASLPGIVPGSADRLYTFPQEWAIRYHGPIKKWIDFPMVSVLKSVETNQAAQGSTRMMDGAPVATELKLTFTEVMTLDKKKYDQRVAAFTNQTGNDRENSQEGGSLDDIMGRRPDDISLKNKMKDFTGVGQAKQRDGTVIDKTGLDGNTFFPED